MQWLQTMGNTLGTEAAIFLLLILFIIYRFTSKTAKKDIDRIEGFLDKIDSESLIHLSEMDMRSEDHRDTIKRNIKTINQAADTLKVSVKEPTTQGIVTVVDDCLGTISANYLKVIKAIKAIKQREINHLKEQNELLARQLKEANELLDNVTLECARVVTDEVTHSHEARERINHAIDDLQNNQH